MGIKGIPKKEIIWVKRTMPDGSVYYITSNEMRSVYYLYRAEAGSAVKVGKGCKTPVDLEKSYLD